MSDIQTIILNSGTATLKKALIIIFHGWGADNNNMADLGEEFLNFIPDAVCYVPNGIIPCEMNPRGRAWFDLHDPSTGIRFSNDILQSKMASILPKIKDFIQSAQKKENISPDQTFLVGFSQGAMLSLHLGLTYPNLIKGVVAYSGGLLGKNDWKNPDPKVSYLLIHGQDDMVVQVSQFHFTKQVLQENNLQHQGIVFENLEHTIHEKGVILGYEFIQKELKF